MSLDKTITSVQIPGPREAHPEQSGHRNQGTAGDRIILVSVCTTDLTLCQSSPYPNSTRENWSLRSTNTQACRRDKPQWKMSRPANTRDNQMAKGKHKKLNNRNQDYVASSEPNSHNTASCGYPNTLEKQDLDLKSHLMRTLRRTEITPLKK